MEESLAYLRNLAKAAHEAWVFVCARACDADAFELVELPHKAQGSRTYKIDLEAERTLHDALRRELDPALLCTGEEFPRAADELAASDRFAATDALDGSTLLWCGLNHWAVVAAVVENRPNPSILAAVVVDSAGEVWGAHRELEGVYDGSGTVRSCLLSRRCSLKGSALAFSGTTPSKIARMQQRLGETFGALKLVINFAGAPGILMVLKGKVDCAMSTSRGYDFAPAAFIAQKGGAYVARWDGTEPLYREALLDSTVKHPWIVAANQNLGDDLQKALGGK